LKTKASLEPLLSAYHDRFTRNDAIVALAQTPDVKALDAYVDGLTQTNLTIRESTRQAMRAIREDARPILEKRTNSPELAKELRLIYGSETSASPDDYLQHGLAEKGNPMNGKKLFASSCIQCHAVGAEGAKVGPDLTTV